MDNLNFNGEMFRLARQFRGHTQRELAAALSAEPSTISRIENDVAQPSTDLVSRAAEKLRVPSEFFYQTERIYGLPVSVHPMWRKKASAPQHETDRALAELNIRIMHLRRLKRSVEYEPILPMPEFDIESYDGDAEKIAILVRRTWLLPAGPVKDLTAWVERAGCFVIHVDLPPSAMDGVTLRVPDAPPCIFLNKNLPSDRMRFTLAHELGHLVMHRLPTPDMEQEANAFAGEFLMPANDIRPFFLGRRIDLRLLAALKPEWRVSMQTLLYRAKKLDLVDPNQYRYLWQQFNIHKIRMREPPELDIENERSSLMLKLVSLHLDQLGYSMSELAKLAVMHESEVVDLYGARMAPTRPVLKIVS